MTLTVTIIAGAYRATDREIINRQPYREQPGDLIVQVSASDVDRNPYIIMLRDMLRVAEESLNRQLSPVIAIQKEEEAA